MIHAYKCSMRAPLVIRHTSRRQFNSCHTLISMSGVMVLHFFFTEAPRCLKLLISASNAIGRWGITVEMSPECPLNWNNWFMLHKLQHIKCFLLRSCHYRCVTSQTEREGSRIAHEQKIWTPAVSFHVENLLVHAFLKPWWQSETASVILIHPVLGSKI